MKSFLEKHAKNIIGVLNGWDRIVFRGTVRLVANLAGMNQYLSYLGILMKDFEQICARENRGPDPGLGRQGRTRRPAEPVSVLQPNR